MTLDISVGDVAYLKGAKDYARMGLVPAGAYRNREFVQPDLDDGNIEEVYLDLLCDPQTSGGLLFSVPEAEAAGLLSDLRGRKIETEVSVIGRVLEKQEKLIRLR